MKSSTFFTSLAIITGLAISGCKQIDPAVPGQLVPKTVDQDVSLPSISVSNTMFHSETFGNPDSPMIVVLHGGPGGDYRSLLNCKDFANDGYFVVFYDQRGSGLSKRHDKNTYSIQLMIDDLHGVIQHYQTSLSQKIFLFGHSWGAMLATDYINSYPDEIDGVVLAEPGGFTWEDTKAYVNRTRDLGASSEQMSDVMYPDQFITGNENDHDILDYKFALTTAPETYEDNPTGHMGATPFWRYGAAMNSALFEIADKDGFDFTTNLNQYKTKVLFLYSELNKAYGLEHAQKVSSAYLAVELQEIYASGHEMIYENWTSTHQYSIDYFNSLK